MSGNDSETSENGDDNAQNALKLYYIQSRQNHPLRPSVTRRPGNEARNVETDTATIPDTGSPYAT
jgi:hypothetical protein